MVGKRSLFFSVNVGYGRSNDGKRRGYLCPLPKTMKNSSIDAR